MANELVGIDQFTGQDRPALPTSPLPTVPGRTNRLRVGVRVGGRDGDYVLPVDAAQPTLLTEVEKVFPLWLAAIHAGCDCFLWGTRSSVKVNIWAGDTL